MMRILRLAGYLLVAAIVPAAAVTIFASIRLILLNPVVIDGTDGVVARQDGLSPTPANRY